MSLRASSTEGSRLMMKGSAGVPAALTRAVKACTAMCEDVEMRAKKLLQRGVRRHGCYKAAVHVCARVGGCSPPGRPHVR